VYIHTRIVILTTLAALRPVHAQGAPEIVTVRGAELERGHRDADSAGSVVRGARMRAPGTTAADVLRAETGVTVNETGGYGALSTVQVRGSSSAQVPVYLAGIRLNDDVTGAADLSLVPTWLLARAEIYRGAAPFSADPWGLGGAVFFEPLAPNGTHAALGAMRGSFGARGTWLRAAVGNGRAGAIFGIRLEGAQNRYTYEDNGGTPFNTGDDRARPRTNAQMTSGDVWSLAHVQLARHASVDLLIQGVSRNQGVPGLALVPNQAASMRTERGMLGARTRVHCGTHCVVTTHAATTHTSTVLTDPLYELALLAPNARALGDRTEAGGAVESGERWPVAVSARLARESIRTVLDGQRLSGRLAAQVSRAFGSFDHVRVMASLDGIETSGRGTASTSVLPSVRASGATKIGPVSLRGNAGSYVRIPTLGELYGIASAVRGNPNLQRESGVSIDLSASTAPLALSERTHVEFGITAFGRVSRDLVAFERSSLGYVVPYNVGSARTAGLEFDAAATFGRHVRLHCGTTALSSSDTNGGGSVIPFQSRLVAQPRLELLVPRIGLLGIDRGTANIGYVYQSNRYADAAGIGIVPAQGSLTASLELELSVMRLALRGTNLFGERRYDTVGYPLPGPAVYASTELVL
jgi:vitamin B12 transporter